MVNFRHNIVEHEKMLQWDPVLGKQAYLERDQTVSSNYRTFYGQMWAGYLSQYSVWLRTTAGRSGFDPRQRWKDFSSILCVQTGSGAHPASCTMGAGGLFRGDKARPGRDADHSPPSTAEVVNE
jgi:hypothetical protein